MEATKVLNKKKLVPKLRFKGFVKVWKKMKLVEVSDKIQDGTHFSPIQFDQGNYKYITSKNIRNGYMDLTEVAFLSDEAHQEIYKRCDVKFNDILLTKDGSATGTICLNELNEEFSLLSSVAFIRANKSITINNFLYQYLAGPKGQFEIHSSIAGQAITRITLSKLRNYNIVLPEIPEQQKIASFLSAVDKKIQLLTRKKELLEQYKKAVMQQLFSGKLRFKDENGKDFPIWEEKKIASVCIRSSGKSKSVDIIEDGANIIVDMGSISRDCKLLGTKRTNCQEDYLETDELVMAKDDIGGGNIIGKVVLIPENNKYVCGDHVYRLKVIVGDVSYIYFAINSFEVNKSFRRKANGTAQIGINNKTVDDQSIPFPILEEQKMIADYLSNLDNKIELVSSEISGAQEFKKGLLQQMFV